MSIVESPQFAYSPESRITWRTIVGKTLLNNLHEMDFVRRLEEASPAVPLISFSIGEIQGAETKRGYSVLFGGVMSEKKPVLFITPYLSIVTESPETKDVIKLDIRRVSESEREQRKIAEQVWKGATADVYTLAFEMLNDLLHKDADIATSSKSDRRQMEASVGRFRQIASLIIAINNSDYAYEITPTDASIKFYGKKRKYPKR